MGSLFHVCSYTSVLYAGKKMLENLSSDLPVPCLDNKDPLLGGGDNFHICCVQTLTDLHSASSSAVD